MENNEALKDMEITCKTCGNTFIHSVKDQIFYQEMNFQNRPKACPNCRREKKEARNRRENTNTIQSFNTRNNDNHFA